MPSLLLIRTSPDKRSLRRSLRGKPVSCRIGPEDSSGTHIDMAWLPPAADMGARLTRRAWRRIERLVKERDHLFALAPDIDRHGISAGLYTRGMTLLDGDGVRQHLTVAAMERWFTLLGPETVAEMVAAVEDADGKWGPLWVRFLSRWVRYLTVSGRKARLQRLQREMLDRDGTVLTLGSPGGRADIRILLDSLEIHGDERILIDGRPGLTGGISGAIYSGWPDVPAPEPGDRLTLWEKTLAGIYHVQGRRFFEACTPVRDTRTRRDIGGALQKGGVQIKGFMTRDTIVTFDRMRYMFYQEWIDSLAVRKKRRLDNCANHDL